MATIDIAAAERDYDKYIARADALHAEFLAETDPVRKAETAVERDVAVTLYQNARHVVLGY